MTRCKQCLMAIKWTAAIYRDLRKPIPPSFMATALLIGDPEEVLRCKSCYRRQKRKDFSGRIACSVCLASDKRSYDKNERPKNGTILGKVEGLYWGAKRRASIKNIPFSITRWDVMNMYCEVCPVLGIRLDWTNLGRMVNGSPTLDRFYASHGYILGNVKIISWRANCLKRDSTLQELEKIAVWMSDIESQNFVGAPVETVMGFGT